MHEYFPKYSGHTNFSQPIKWHKYSDCNYFRIQRQREMVIYSRLKIEWSIYILISFVIMLLPYSLDSYYHIFFHFGFVFTIKHIFFLFFIYFICLFAFLFPQVNKWISTHFYDNICSIFYFLLLFSFGKVYVFCNYLCDKMHSALKKILKV